MQCQLSPCRFFVEIFCRNSIDIDAWYIFRGIVFGFRVIDDDCDICYDTRVHRITDSWERTIIEDRLNAELESAILMRSESAPTCVHGILIRKQED